MIEYSIAKMKELYETSKKNPKKNNKDEYIIYNIYNHLNDRRQSKATVMEAGKIREAQLIIKNENILFDGIEKIGRAASNDVR